MTAVQDFLADPVWLEGKLAIPPLITTVRGFAVDTTGPVWVTPSSCNNFDWSHRAELGGLLRVIQAYAAALLIGRSETTSDNFYSAFKAVHRLGGWREVALQWLIGEITFAAMLTIRQALIKEYPQGITSEDYFAKLRRWYYWANGLSIPGFTEETVDKLRTLKLKKYVPFLVQQQIAPSAPKSRATKNRDCYTDMDLARIQAALLRLEGRLNLGEIILSNGVDFSSLAPNHRAGILKYGRQIGTRHLVVGWLACLYGDRTTAFCQLRESDFEFTQVDGVGVGTVRFSDAIKRSYGRLTKPAKRAALPLNGELVRLVPKLIAENRAWAVSGGIDPDCDLPLFPMRTTPRNIQIRMSLEDNGARFFKSSPVMGALLKQVFKVLNVKKSDGKVIVPTFYSFRDSNHTRWARKMPLEAVAALTGKKGIRSFKHYMKPGIRHIARLDSVTEYQDLARALNPPVPLASIALETRIPAPFPYVEAGERRVGVQGGCGCYGSACPMAFDGTVDCYVCPAFTPCVEGPHEWILRVLVNRQADMIARGLPRSEWTRYDRHIAHVGHVIQLVIEWRRKHLNAERP